MAKIKRFSFYLNLLLYTGIGLAGALCFFVVLLVLIPEYKNKRGFEKLTDMVAYAGNLPEYPDMDNTNLVRPDYSAFYRSQRKGYFSVKLASLLTYLGMRSPDTWSAQYYAQLIKDSLSELEKDSFKKSFICKLSPQPGDTFVLWGDVQGAFHSLVRCLVKLYEMGVLSNELKITQPHITFVFMGDVISRSAYGMQTLSLILRLMQQNPEQVMYLRGNHEDKKYWHAFGLKNQIELLAPDILTIQQIDDIFMQLPLGVYLTIPGERDDFVRLSHLGWQRSTKLHEERYVQFLQAVQKEKIDRYHIDKNITQTDSVTISAVVRSEKKRHSFQEMDGIRLLPSERGATTWTFFSSPTKVSQEGLQFYHDAFGVIRVGTSKEDWSVTLYNQDVRKLNEFALRSYEFFSGEEKL